MAEYFDEEASGSGTDMAEREGPLSGKHADYVFTLNNYVLPDDYDFIREFAEKECVYLVYQHECGENGTPHFQGYFRFKSRRSFRSIRGLLTRNGTCRFHLEPRRGTIEQAITYCTDAGKRDLDTNGGIVEYGIRPTGQGTRTDIRNCVNAVKSGKSVRECFDSFPDVMVKYARGIAAARIAFEDQRDFKTYVKWYYGTTGTGKSRLARDETRDVNTYWKAGASKWWDGYDGQETVIVDDYRCDLCPFHILLRLFDRYPLQVEGKGTMHQFRSKTIIITAPNRPEVMWRGRNNEDMQQLLRRIEEIKLFGEEPIEHSILPTFNH